MTLRHENATAARRALAWTLGTCLALTAGSGCNGSVEAIKSEAGTTAVANANPIPDPAGKGPVRKGRKAVDTSSRREHVRQLKQQQK